MHNTETIAAAVERLNSILPLTARHRALDTPLRRLHKMILRSYMELGRTLSRSEMALHIDDIDNAVNILKRDDLVVFDEHGEPVGAYPFTMEERDHVINVNNHTLHCMCALDALAVSPMFNMPATINSRCHITTDPITIQQRDRDILNLGEAGDIHFGINWNAASNNSCCANSLCTEMIFLKTQTVATNWLDEAPEQRQIFCLSDAIDFAAQFFVPLIRE